jgi:DNA repair protein RadD
VLAPALYRLLTTTGLDVSIVQPASQPQPSPDDWLTVPASIAAVLRPYQHELIERTAQALPRSRKVCLTAPTGAGKTHVITAIAAAADQAGLRALILATRTRLVRQLHDRLVIFDVDHGVIAAQLPELRWHNARVQVASVDTLYRRCLVEPKRMQLPGADVVIFDEAHLAAAATRVAILNAYPDAVRIGLTATPARQSGRALSEIFDELVVGPSIAELIASGMLVRPRIFNVPVVSNEELRAVPKDAANDYQSKALGELLSRPKLVGDVVENWLRIAGGKRTLVFAITQAHAAQLAQEFRRNGVAAELLIDSDDEQEREAVIARLESGETRVVINCFLMSYGVDVPSVEVIVLARPTRSLSMFLQMVGRGLRPAEGKTDCLILDHGRVIEHLGLPHIDREWTLDDARNMNQEAREHSRKATTEQPRTCPQCHHMWLVSEEGEACISCGWKPVPRAKAVAFQEADLAEMGEGPMASESDQQRFYAELRGYAQARNFKGGWAAHKYKEKFGRFPPWSWNSLAAVPPSVATQNWARSRFIAWRKARR